MNTHLKGAIERYKERDYFDCTIMRAFEPNSLKEGDENMYLYMLCLLTSASSKDNFRLEPKNRFYVFEIFKERDVFHYYFNQNEVDLDVFNRRRCMFLNFGDSLALYVDTNFVYGENRVNKDFTEIIKKNDE